VAVASAGPYASLHLAPDRQPHQHPTTRVFTGRMPFLPPNQQRQSTEGKCRDRAVFQFSNMAVTAIFDFQKLETVSGWSAVAGYAYIAL